MKMIVVVVLKRAESEARMTSFVVVLRRAENSLHCNRYYIEWRGLGDGKEWRHLEEG